MVKIWFKDSIARTSSSGKVYLTNEPDYFYVNSRLVFNYIPPIITEDSWNGKTFPVQINAYEGYQVQIAAKEMASNALSKLQSCKQIVFEEIETGEVVEVDTLASQAITIEPRGRLGTVDQGYIINIKSEKLPFYPAMASENINKLHVELDSLPYDFYTDFDIITFLQDAEKQSFSYDDALQITAKTTAKAGKRLVFYLNETDANSLKQKVEFAEIGDVTINPDSDNFVSLETGKCTVTALTEGLYKCEVEIITTGYVKFYEEATITEGATMDETQIFVTFDDDTYVNYD